MFQIHNSLGPSDISRDNFSKIYPLRDKKDYMYVRDSPGSIKIIKTLKIVARAK